MKVNYTVHSVSEAPIVAIAQVGGKDREVSMPGLVIEIVSDDGSMSHTLRLADDLDAAQKLFVTGKTITATFSGSK